MKKFSLILLTAAAVLTAFSCQKNGTSGPALQDNLSKGQFTVNIGVNDETTKSDNTTKKDFQINKFQVFVFNSSNVLETDVYKTITPVDNATSATLATFTGAKTVYVVVNNDRLYLTPQTTTLAQFELLLTDLSQVTPTNIVMSGRNTITVTEYNVNKNPSAAPQNLDIWVKRLACAVILNRINVNFSETSLRNAAFTVQEIYLKNVVGKCHFALTGNTPASDSAVVPVDLTTTEHTNYSYWYNKATKQVSPTPPEVTVDGGLTIDCNVAGTNTALNRVLFAFPNKTDADSHAAAFDQRHTRVVIKAHVTKNADGISIDKDTYYVFDLPILVANRIYSITDINITMLGKEDDNNDDELLTGRISPQIHVSPWVNADPLIFDF